MTNKNNRFYINYFETICSQLKAIGHSVTTRKFYRSIDEFTGTGLEYPVVIFVPAGSRISTQGGDNYFKNPSINLWILRSCTSDDFEVQQEIYDETEEIAIDIISRIKRDVEDYASGPADRLLKGFDLTNIPMDDIMFKGQDNCFGTNMGITIKNPVSLAFDASKWDI